MRRFFLFTTVFLVACGGKVFVDTLPSDGTTTGSGASGGSGGYGGSGGWEGPCYVCACEHTVTEGGCEDICTMGLNGTTSPNFCDGSNALPQCAACILNNCGFSPPSDCGM